MLFGIFRGIESFLKIIRYLLLAYCLLSWIMPPYRGFMATLSRFVDPILRPIRNLLFRFFPRLPIDLSPLLLMLLLEGLRQLLWRGYYGML